MKIIFLDIDGVLNSDEWNKSHQTEMDKGILIDEEKVHILAQLIHKTNASIVLHSGWRTWFDTKGRPTRAESTYLVNTLQKEAISIAEFTPDLTTEEIRQTKKFSLVKADEILLYLKQHKEIQNWVVLDDIDLHNDTVKQHQVKTDFALGLTLDDIEKAESMLLN